MYVNGKKIQRQVAPRLLVLLLPLDATALTALLAQNIYIYICILYNNRFTICLNHSSLTLSVTEGNGATHIHSLQQLLMLRSSMVARRDVSIECIDIETD